MRRNAKSGLRDDLEPMPNRAYKISTRHPKQTLYASVTEKAQKFQLSTCCQAVSPEALDKTGAQYHSVALSLVLLDVQPH